MKLVYIHDNIARIGGVERIFSDKMNYLVNVLGYEVYLITCNQGNHPFSFFISPKVKHIDLEVPIHLQYRYKYPLRIWKKWELNKKIKTKLTDTISKISPDIIIGTTSWMGDVICQLKTPAKKIIESHNARSFTGIKDGSHRNKIIEYLHKYSLKKEQQIIEENSNVLITLTTGDAKEWEKAKNIRVIPNMTQVALHHKNVSDTKHIISVGRFAYQKGFERLVSAWEIVHQSHPDWSLDIYGDNGTLKQDIERQIVQLNLSNVIAIHNPTNEIAKRYQESEFYVMSSRYEGWGLVLVEAMACGIPCIAFDCPYGPNDIIEHGKNGLLVENGDIQGLADAICWMIEHKEERKQMGIAAKETSKRYRPEVIMKQWDELFKELVKQ